jgi:hypothetical protein
MHKKGQTGTNNLENVFGIHFQFFLNYFTTGGEQVFSRPGCFSPWKRPVFTLSIGFLVGSSGKEIKALPRSFLILALVRSEITEQWQVSSYIIP